MRQKNYPVKIIILFIFTFICILAIWYTMIREESVDWITSRVVRQVSPYAVAATEEGQTIIDNVMVGYNFILPPGFKTTGAKNLSFWLEENGQKKCEIKHYLIQSDGPAPEAAGKMVIPLNGKDLIFELIGQTRQESICLEYLEQIKADLEVD